MISENSPALKRWAIFGVFSDTALGKVLESLDHFVRFLKLNEMAGVVDDHQLRPADTGVNGPGVNMNVRDVRFTHQDQGRRFDLTEPFAGRRREFLFESAVVF